GMLKDAWHCFSDNGYVHYDVEAPGFKYNLTDLAASFGIHQLARVEPMRQRRQELWDHYQSELKGLPLVLPEQPAAGTRHALHLFACLVDETKTKVMRDQVLARLYELRIGVGVYYLPVHLFTYYRNAHGGKPGDCPNVESIGTHTFSIPFSPALYNTNA